MKPKKITKVWLLWFLAVFSWGSSAQAQEDDFMHTGKWIFTLQLAAGQVRVADTNGILPSIFFPYNQNGVDLGLSYGLNNQWAVSLSGNLGFSSYKNEYPDTISGVPAGIEDKIKTSSWVSEAE